MWSQPKPHLNNVNCLIYDFSISAKAWVSVWTECVDHFNPSVVILFSGLWMVWIHYLTNLAMQASLNPTTSTVRKYITSVMFALTTFISYLLLRYKCKMQECVCLSVSVCLSICLYIHMEHLVFSRNLICIFQKLPRKFKLN